MARTQLQLIDADRSWKLDRRTVEIGRAGVARARAALAAATISRVADEANLELGAAVEATSHPAAA